LTSARDDGGVDVRLAFHHEVQDEKMGPIRAVGAAQPGDEIGHRLETADDPEPRLSGDELFGVPTLQKVVFHDRDAPQLVDVLSLHLLAPRRCSEQEPTGRSRPSARASGV
jgi:hypothetical protein